MELEDLKVVCKVCHTQFARYICPRCNIAYCTLACYKQHSGPCTEAFYREQAVDQLKGTKAGDAERKQVLQLLQRVHEQQLQEDDQMMREALGIPGASSSSYIQEDDEGGDDGAEAQGEQGQTEENRDVVLTRETLERLALKAQQHKGPARDFEISEEDLTPEELRAFQRAAAAGMLSHLLPPWVPWWEGPEAQGLTLSATGQRAVQEVGGPGGAGAAERPAGSGSGAGQKGASGGSRAGAREAGEDSGGASEDEEEEEDNEEDEEEDEEEGLEGPAPLPPGPSQPLQPLSALTKAQPSPLLRWQLLELLYAYCFVLRQYNGDAGEEDVVLDAVDSVLALCPALGALPPKRPASSAPGGSSRASAASSQASNGSIGAPPQQGQGAASAAPGAGSQAGPQGPGVQVQVPQSAAQALLDCLTRACMPPVGEASARGLAVAVLADVAALLRAGCGAVVLALTDLHRMVGAAEQQAGTGGGAGRGPGRDARPGVGQGMGGKKAAQQLAAAHRKLWFFMCWAHEQRGSGLMEGLLADAAQEEWLQHREALQLSGGAKAGAGGRKEGLNVVGGAGQRLGRGGPKIEAL